MQSSSDAQSVPTIRERRIAVGVTQERLAELAEMSWYTLNRCEMGHRMLREAEAARLNVVLAVFEEAVVEAERRISASSASGRAEKRVGRNCSAES